MPVTATTIISTATLIKDSLMDPFIPVVADGTPPYVFSIGTTTALPAGLNFNTSTGYISGVPTELANLVEYTITVVDANTTTSTSSFRLTVQSEIIPYLKRLATAVEGIENLHNRIADSVENISESIGTISEISTTTGIRTNGAYDWTKPLEMVSWYGQGFGLTSVSTATTNQLVTIINSLTNNVSKFE